MSLISEKERTLLGIRIHSFEMEELINVINEFIFKKEEKLIVYGFSANIYSRIRKSPDFINFFREIDIVVADGQGIPILAKIFDVDIPNRIGIVNLANRLLIDANKKKLKIFLLGSTQELNEKACQKIRYNYPAIKACSGINGYFAEIEEKTIVEQINLFNPDILYIGISSPKKERFALKYKDELETKLIIPCGGWIDVVAEKTKRPPFILKRMPITWFIRFIQEPRRLFKPVIVSVFDFTFRIFPILYFKHLFGVEKNPSIIRHFKLEEYLKD